MKIISIAAIFVAMLVMMMLGSKIMAFIDVPSLILVFTVCVFAVLARHGLGGFRLLFDAEQNDGVTHTLGYAALLAGLLAFPLAGVSVLSVADSMKFIGPSMAVSMLSPFYGLVIYVCCFFLNPRMKVDSSAAILMLPLSILSIFTFMLITWLIKGA